MVRIRPRVLSRRVLMLKSKHQFLEYLTFLFEIEPHMRVSQHLENALGCHMEKCLYYMSDEEALEKMEKYVTLVKEAHTSSKE